MCHLLGYKDSAVIQVEEKDMQVSVHIYTTILGTVDINCSQFDEAKI